jgi:hypothetical protein
MGVDSFLSWLESTELTDSSGHVLSWWSTKKPGYAYPEVSGLLLTLLAHTGAGPARQRALRTALRQVPGGRSGIGRFGMDYTFDLAMVVRGLLRTRDPDESEIGMCKALLERTLQRLPGDQPQPLRRDTRWSLSFGAHQAKVAGAALECRRYEALRENADGVLLQLREDTLRLQDDDGRFRIHAESGQTYLHSHCYAVEGLLMMADAGITGHTTTIASAANWLARVQAKDGGVQAWYDGRVATGPSRTDATAQMLRIFRLVDAGRFTAEISASAEFLRRHTVPGRGVRYEPGSGDVNTWATIFAVQALAPADHPAAARRGRDLV